MKASSLSFFPAWCNSLSSVLCALSLLLSNVAGTLMNITQEHLSCNYAYAWRGKSCIKKIEICCYPLRSPCFCSCGRKRKCVQCSKGYKVETCFECSLQSCTLPNALPQFVSWSAQGTHFNSFLRCWHSCCCSNSCREAWNSMNLWGHYQG